MRTLYSTPTFNKDCGCLKGKNRNLYNIRTGKKEEAEKQMKKSENMFMFF